MEDGSHAAEGLWRDRALLWAWILSPLLALDGWTLKWAFFTALAPPQELLKTSCQMRMEKPCIGVFRKTGEDRGGLGMTTTAGGCEEALF